MSAPASLPFGFGLAALFFGEPSLAQTASDAPASAPKRLDDEDAKQVEGLQKSIEQLRRAVKFTEAAAPGVNRGNRSKASPGLRDSASITPILGRVHPHRRPG